MSEHTDGDGTTEQGTLRFPDRADIPLALVAAVEALLFASGDPIATRELARVLDVDPGEVRAALATLQDRHRGEGAGLRLVRVASGWQLRTAPELAAVVLALRGARPARISRAALEVLAVVAYEQPVTRHEIERLRGVDSGGVLKTLLDKGLVRVGGRRDEPGRPLEYRTAPAFLEMFSLASLDGLPTLQERAELVRDADEPPLARLDAQGDDASDELEPEPEPSREG